MAKGQGNGGVSSVQPQLTQRVVVVTIGTWAGVDVVLVRPGKLAEIDLVLETGEMAQVPAVIRGLALLVWQGTEEELEHVLASAWPVVVPYTEEVDEVLVQLVDLLADVRVRSPRYKQLELVLQEAGIRPAGEQLLLPQA